MARPLRIEYSGAFYHVTSRGNEQKDVFKSQKDREKFLSYLESATERYGAVIHAYCLLSNHYHILLETPAGNLSQIMRHINGAYRKVGNGCQQVQLPENAVLDVYGSGWVCARGYRKVGNGCQEVQ